MSNFKIIKCGFKKKKQLLDIFFQIKIAGNIRMKTSDGKNRNVSKLLVKTSDYYGMNDDIPKENYLKLFEVFGSCKSNDGKLSLKNKVSIDIICGILSKLDIDVNDEKLTGVKLSEMVHTTNEIVNRFQNVSYTRGYFAGVQSCSIGNCNNRYK